MRRDLWLTGLAALLVMAAAVPLHRVFSSTAWRGDAFVAMLVAIAAAAVARRVGLNAVASTIVSVLGLVALSTALHAPTHGPWPSLAAMDEVVDLARLGLEQVRYQPAPTEPLDGIMVLVTGGIWLVAHVVHESLVRLQRPGPALLAAGTLWVTPLAVPRDPVAAWPNALPMFLVVGLVLVAVQSRDEAGWAQERLPRSGIATGLGLTAAAAVLGLVAPWLLPGHDQPAWLDVSTASEPRGYQPIVDVGDRLHLPEPRDVLEVNSANSLYLRLAALDTFDGRTWRLGPPGVDTYRPDPDNLFSVDGDLPFEALIATGSPVAASVNVLDLENIYVPVPYQTTRIEGPPNAGLFYSLEGGFIATGDVADNEISGDVRVGVRAGFEYDVEAVVPTPAYADLVALGEMPLTADDPRLALPVDYGALRGQAEQIYAETGASTRIDRALAVQNWFIGPDSDFVYSTDVPELRGDQALQDFVFTTKTGYCEYYATAMAVMLRATGVPARVAVGFLPGRVTVPPLLPGDDATFVVSTTDAHAWVEVFFDDHGWVRMDPTPRSEALPASVDDLVPQPLAAPEREPLERPTDLPSDAATDAPSEVPTVEPVPEPATGTGGIDQGSVVGAGLVILLVLALLTGILVVAIVEAPRWRRWRDRGVREPIEVVLASQARVLATAAQLGFERRDAETITEVAARWVQVGAAPPDVARRFVALSSQAAFAGRASAEDAAEALEVERRLISGFGDALGRRGRITTPLARLFDTPRDQARRVSRKVRQASVSASASARNRTRR